MGGGVGVRLKIDKRKSRVCYYKQELQSLANRPLSGTGHLVEKDDYELYELHAAQPATLVGVAFTWYRGIILH